MNGGARNPDVTPTMRRYRQLFRFPEIQMRMSARMVLIVSIGLIAGTTFPALAQPKPKPAAQSQPTRKEPHRVVIQITRNVSAVMNMALTTRKTWFAITKAGEKVDIEFVAYGPDCSWSATDTSPVKDRLASIAARNKTVTVSGCENTMAAQSAAEHKEITLAPTVQTVSTGIGRIVDLQERGWIMCVPDQRFAT